MAGHLSYSSHEVQELCYSCWESIYEKRQPLQWTCTKIVCLWAGHERSIQPCVQAKSFRLQNFGVFFIGLTVNGEERPFKPIQLSHAAVNSRYIKAYSTLFSGLGKMNYDCGNNISRLTSDMCGASSHFNTVQQGNLALDLKFSVTPAAAVSLVCYGEFENMIQIDSERNVVYDYMGYMNTAQIAHALEQDPVMSKTFCGMFPSNKLPQTIIKYPCEFVANTDPSDKPGTQWVAFYIPTEEKGEFFDSYGQPPSFYRDCLETF